MDEIRLEDFLSSDLGAEYRTDSTPVDGREALKRRRRSAKAKHAQRTGDETEKDFAEDLRKLGVKQVEKIEVPWRFEKDAAGNITKRFALRRIEGDFTGILPVTINDRRVGVRVLMECKKRTGDRIQYSEIKAHQLRALNETHQNGGIALLGWDDGVNRYIMRWPIPGFKKRTSIKREKALKNLWSGSF